MSYCREPKRKILRTDPGRPIIAIPVAAGCPCAGGSAVGAVVVDIQLAGDDTADVIRYPLYDFNEAGDPRFYLDYQVLNTPAIYTATVTAGVDVDGARQQIYECGKFDFIVGKMCSVGQPYISTPNPNPSPSGGGAVFTIPYDDMNPSYNIQSL